MIKHEEMPRISKVNVDISYCSFATPDFQMRHLLIKCEYAMTQDMILKSVENFLTRMTKEYEKIKEVETLKNIDETKIPTVNIYISPRIDHKEVIISMLIDQAEITSQHYGQISDQVFYYFLKGWLDMQKKAVN